MISKFYFKPIVFVLLLIILLPSVFAFFDFRMPTKKELSRMRAPDYPKWVDSYAFISNYNSSTRFYLERFIGVNPNPDQFTGYCLSAFKQGSKVGVFGLREAKTRLSKFYSLVSRKDSRGKLVYCSVRKTQGFKAF